jgi:hypothetical protein
MTETRPAKGKENLHTTGRRGDGTQRAAKTEKGLKGGMGGGIRREVIRVDEDVGEMKKEVTARGGVTKKRDAEEGG